MSDPLREYLQSLPEWSNKHRCASLFADLNRLRSINPVAYEANVGFWKAVVMKAAEQNWTSTSNTLSVTAEELAQRAEKDGIRPIGLGTVLAELHRSGHVLPLSEFLNTSTGPGGIAGKIVKRLIWDPIVWTWRQFGFGQDREQVETGIETRPFVLMSAVSNLADQLLKRHYESSTYPITDNLLTLSELRSQIFSQEAHKNFTISSKDEKVLLRYWETNGLAAVINGVDSHGSGSIVKFRSRDSRDGTVEITTTDRGIVQIKETRLSVSRQVDDLEEKISLLMAKAREDVKIPHRKPLVLSSLRRKKLLHEILEKRIHSLETLDAVVMKLQNAASDAEILQAYNVGADTLQSVLKESGLNVETVDAAMDRLSEVMADQKEIEDAISSGGIEIQAASGAIDWDQEELERELEELIKTEEKDVRAESGTQDRTGLKPLVISSTDSKDETAVTAKMLERLQVLPNVPSEVPGTQDSESDMMEKEQNQKLKTPLEKTLILA